MKYIFRMEDAPSRSSAVLVLHPHSSDFTEQLRKAVAHGCGEPIRLTPQLVGRGYEFGSLPFRIGVPLTTSQPLSFAEVRRHLDYLLHSRPAQGCRAQMKLDPDMLEWFQKETFRPRERGKKTRQVERSGRVVLHPVSSDTVVARILPDKVARGDAESTPSHTTFGSFHTHPEDAYRRHRVCVAFPSSGDYQVSFDLYMSHGSCFHLLSAIEGVYLMTVKPSFARLNPRRHLRSKRTIEKWSEVIRRAYNDGYPGCSLDRKNLQTYQMKYISKYLLCINRKPIFDVQFLTWEDAKTKGFNWSYAPERDNCILTDRQYRHLYKSH